ncbi:MAG: diaminopimelate decarboxylase [bacterium]|jgi:diaminopimelate decarboxylase
MDQFVYRDSVLFGEGVNLATVADAVGTPCYVYSRATLEDHADKLAGAFGGLNPLICFAVKCCPNVHVLRALVGRGLGMDVVSGGELYRARLAGAPGDRIVFAGVGKSDQELREALGAWTPTAEQIAQARAMGVGPEALVEPIGCFNIESEQEYEVLAGVARAAGKTCRAAIRVNPKVKAGGHAHITTATEESKFGVMPEQALAMFKRFGGESTVRLTGLHMHIGSSILDPGPYVEAVKRLLELADAAMAAGARLSTLDIGGGFGADYSTGDAAPAAEFASALTPLLEPYVKRGIRVVLEPGRTIAANAGVLLTRVLYTKVNGRKKFVVVDAGMNTLIRPSLYEAFHFAWPVSVAPQHEPVRRTASPELPGLEVCDLVGPVCESGDFLARDRMLPPLVRGDLVAVYAAGAYGMAMASRYNSRNLPAEVMVSGDTFEVIRRGERDEDQLAHEVASR